MKSKSTRILAAVAAVMMIFASAGCSTEKETSENKTTGGVQSADEVQPKEAAQISVETSQISADDLDVGYEESDSTSITFSESGAEINGEGAQVNATIVTITNGGTYVLSGSCQNGRIIVNVDKSEKVKLVLDGIGLGCNNYAPLTVLQADKVTLTLKDNSENSFTDAQEYELGEDDNTDAVIFSKADLTINGEGNLTVKANYKHGIVTKDDLVISGGKITVDSASSALTGKDSVTIGAGEFDLTSGTDAIKTTETEKKARVL